jgi:hypothetical protein
MAKKSKRRPDEQLTKTGETRVADALTVAWMLTVMTVLMLGLMTIGFRWFASARPEAPILGALADLLYLCAALCGGISLLMFPLVWKLRKTKPPWGVTLFSLAAAGLPIALLIARVGLRQ